MTDPVRGQAPGASRREFLQSSGLAAMGTALAAHLAVPSAHAAGDDAIKVGLIGCGGRGTGAAAQCITAAPNVKLVAMGDAFKEHIDSARSNLRKAAEESKFVHDDKIQLTDDRCFVGFDAYKQVIDSGVDLVILATPPGFRPMHLQAAIAAGKHVFCEKPVAVDGPGIRAVLAAAEEAKSKNLAVVAGTQRRHQDRYVEAMKRIHEGAIGEIVSARVSWNQGSLWMRPRKESWTDVEWQLRNWLYFSWLSGDHITEQHVHNLDVANWALNAHPVRAVSLAGREVRVDPAYGNIFDHFATEYEYESGARVASYCRQIDGCENNVSESVAGTKGRWSSVDSAIRAEGSAAWRHRGKERNPYEQEHVDLIESIRSGKPLNELKTVAESTLTAIMGRMSGYTGKAVTWDEAMNSKQVLMPEKVEFGPLPVAAIAVPGVTPFA